MKEKEKASEEASVQGEGSMIEKPKSNRQALVEQLKAKGINQIFGRPLWRCLKEELEFALRQNRPSFLSFSAVNMYLKCGLQYYFRYVLGLKLPPPGVVILGSAVHEGLEFDFTQKIESKENRPTKEILEVYSDRFDREKDNALWGEEENPGEVKDQGSQVLQIYHKDRAQSLQPKEVEKKVKVSFENVDYDLIGYIDLLTEDEQLRDFKTKAKSMSDAEIGSDMQLTTYAFAYHEETGRFPKTLGFDVLVRSPKNPKVQLAETQRGETDCVRLLAYLAHVADGIYKNVFLPAQPGTWVCSPKWCGYYDICQREMISRP